jgi:hypothetical protein
MSDSDHLETAFLNLSFALKLWHYASKGLIKKDEFDIDLNIKDGNSIVVLTGTQFDSDNDIILATENMISINFGVTANILWECINEKGQYTSRKLHNSLITNEQKLAGFTYMLRCCFAHGPANLRWKMDKQYLIQYKVGNRFIDLSKLNNKDFAYMDIGGYDTLWILKVELKSLGMI